VIAERRKNAIIIDDDGTDRRSRGGDLGVYAGRSSPQSAIIVGGDEAAIDRLKHAVEPRLGATLRDFVPPVIKNPRRSRGTSMGRNLTRGCWYKDGRRTGPGTT
jgi:hypothetical protein